MASLFLGHVCARFIRNYSVKISNTLCRVMLETSNENVFLDAHNVIACTLYTFGLKREYNLKIVAFSQRPFLCIQEIPLLKS